MKLYKILTLAFMQIFLWYLNIRVPIIGFMN